MFNRIIICTIFFTIISSFRVLYPKSRNDSRGYNNASYILVVVPDKYILNPGDSINIKTYFKGRGGIDENYFHVYVPNYLFTDSIEVRGFEFISFENIIIPTNNKAIFEDKGNFQISLDKSYFRNYSENLIYAEADIQDSLLNEFPPINIRFYIDENADPGNYDLNFSFTYVNNGNVYTATNNVKLKVLSFGEKHQNLLSVSIALLSGFLIFLVDKKSFPHRQLLLIPIAGLLVILLLVLILPSFSIWGLL